MESAFFGSLNRSQLEVSRNQATAALILQELTFMKRLMDGN